MFPEIVLSVLPALADALACARVTGAGFSTDPLVGADVDQLPLFGYPGTVNDIQLRFIVRRRYYVSYHLDLGAIADDLFPLLHRAGAARVEAYRGVELERVPAGGGLGVVEHDADLHTHL